MVLVGLGNPGPEYARTRHNVGFMVMDEVASRLRLSFRKPLFRPYRIAETSREHTEITLVLPLTYMNRSGVAVRTVLRVTGETADSVVVVCDTLDLPSGALRLKRGGSHAGHRGLRSIIDETGCRDFLRLYIGIGRPDSREEVIDYVLGEFGPEDSEIMRRAVSDGADALLALTAGSVQDVMNNVNTKTRESGRLNS
jgi:PTH1 family peptidyl-tRNA hydrolase